MNLIHLKLDKEQLEPHAALSYVRGTKYESGYETRLSNIMRRKEDSALIIDDLPCTIKDAILLVKNLAVRVRFIWIDSMCSSQDSVMSWGLNAESMHLILGNACFTICAADGDSGTG
ncbi:hypothetical protein AOQ84DRAFT_51984 [Glonium stellatum]|uniref:Heterokaryon incompatibility domain-containing protein n=1 Tax=Glonium stellatum TaxID=574774 RepID=A0A8E2EZL2_9PEZI|nr:hypothetical protein AOQ84DRAFT_51984 [Glonium stellatum]